MVPGPGDDAIINAPTKAGYTVTTGVNDTVNSIQTIALTTLSIGGNALFIASACSRAGTGGLAIRKLTIDNSSGGSLLGVSHVDLQSTTLIGGTLKTIGTGVIDTVDRGSLLDETTTAVTNQGVLAITNNTSLNIQGVIANTGTIAMNSGGNVTQIVVTAKNAVLNGTGVVNLTDTSQNFILGTITGARGAQTVSTFTNNSTIQGPETSARTWRSPTPA